MRGNRKTRTLSVAQGIYASALCMHAMRLLELLYSHQIAPYRSSFCNQAREYDPRELGQ